MQQTPKLITEEGLRDKLDYLFQNARDNGVLRAKTLEQTDRDQFIARPSGIKPSVGVYLKDSLIATISENVIDPASVVVHDVSYVPGIGHVVTDVIVYASKSDDYADASVGELYAVTEFIRERWVTQLEALLRLQQEILHRIGTLETYESNGFAVYHAHDVERGLLTDTLATYEAKHEQFRQKVGSLSKLLDARLRTLLDDRNKDGVTHDAN